MEGVGLRPHNEEATGIKALLQLEVQAVQARTREGE